MTRANTLIDIGDYYYQFPSKINGKGKKSHLYFSFCLQFPNNALTKTIISGIKIIIIIIINFITIVIILFWT